MTDEKLLQAIREYLEEKHGPSSGSSFHLLTNEDRNALVDLHGEPMAHVILEHANDPSWISERIRASSAPSEPTE